MKLINVPVLPQWHKTTNNSVCTPDGGFLYIGSRNVNYISSIENNTDAPLIRTFNIRQVVYGVDIDPHWPKNNSTSLNADVKDIVDTSAGTDYDDGTNINIATSATADALIDGGATSVDSNGACNNVAVNGKTSNLLPLRIFAVVNQDNSIQIWDFDKGYAIQGHKAHCGDNNKIRMDGNGPLLQHTPNLLISYICNRNLLSVDKKHLVIYCVASNTYYRRSMFIPSNYTMTVLKCSPFNENQFAIGNSNGLILLCDLQKMSILYTLRGHDCMVVSLAWNKVCSVKTEQQQRKEQLEQQCQKTHQSKCNKSKSVVTDKDSERKKSETVTTTHTDADDMFDIYDYNYLDNEFGTSSDNIMMRANIMKSSPPSNFISKEREGSSLSTENFNFAEACQNLKDDIKAAQQYEHGYEQSDNSRDFAFGDDEGHANYSKNVTVTLDECKQAAALLHQENSHTFSVASTNSLSRPTLSNEEDQQEQHEEKIGVVEANNYDIVKYVNNITSSSDDDSCYGRLNGENVQFVRHQAEVHTMQTKYEQQLPQEILETKANEPVSTDGHHEDDYHSLGGDGNNKCAVNDTDILLASTSVNGSLWLWNTNSGSSCDYHKASGIHTSKCGNFSCVYWLDSKHLITSNKVGNLTFWSVRYETEQINEYRVYKLNVVKRTAFKNKPVVMFNVCQTKQLLWGTTFNKEIYMENLKTNTILMRLGCCSTSIGVIKECTDNMNKIAVGFSDRRIGIIDMSKITPNEVQIQNFSQYIGSPVLALAWSPNNKKICYGTKEGRIGILYVEEPKKDPKLFNSICGKPIYSICWQENYIFVVCNERVAVYDDSNDINKDGFIIPGIMGASALSVHRKYLFIGTRNGQLHLYVWNKPIVAKTALTNLSCKALSQCILTSRYITDIQWCPLVTNQVAISSNSNLIYVFDLNTKDDVLTLRHKITIESTNAANAIVRWSNSNANRLMACGFDGAIRVWDLSSEFQNKVVLNFVKQYHCPMTCGLFLPTNDDIIICAGRSTSLEMFDIRLEKIKELSERQDNKSDICSHANILDKVQWATTALAHNNIKTKKTANKKKKKHCGVKIPVTTPDVLISTKQLKTEENDNDDDTYSTVAQYDNNDGCITKENVSNNSEQISVMLDKLTMKSTTAMSPYLKIPSTLLYLTTKELHKGALKIIHVLLMRSSGQSDESVHFSLNDYQNKEILCAKLYGTREEVKELLDIELKNAQGNEAKHIANIFMPHLTVNLKDEIIKCIQNKQLTEWHVSQAPNVSYMFWKYCCHAFAQQLLEQGHALLASTYMLTIHRPVDAIEMLITKKYYKEALLVARMHLQREDPLCFSISQKWIIHLCDNGDLMQAALICLFTNEKARLVEYLTKIRNQTQEIKIILDLLRN